MAIVRSSSLLSPLRHGSVNRQSLISTVYNIRTYIVIASFDNAQRLALVRFVSKFAFFFSFLTVLHSSLSHLQYKKFLANLSKHFA